MPDPLTFHGFIIYSAAAYLLLTGVGYALAYLDTAALHLIGLFQ